MQIILGGTGLVLNYCFAVVNAMSILYPLAFHIHDSQVLTMLKLSGTVATLISSILYLSHIFIPFLFKRVQKQYKWVHLMWQQICCCKLRQLPWWNCPHQILAVIGSREAVGEGAVVMVHRILSPSVRSLLNPFLSLDLLQLKLYMPADWQRPAGGGKPMLVSTVWLSQGTL